MSHTEVETDPRILGQLLAAQSMFSVFSAHHRIGEFINRALEGMPGVASCAVCMPGSNRPRLDTELAPECADCEVIQGDIDHDPGHLCRLSGQSGIRVLPLKTQERHFGYFLLKVTNDEQLAPYEPFIGNLAGSVAVNIERQWQKDHLEAANTELQAHREHLEDLVQERTTALQLGLERERHLNAVLKAIRNVNQLITREKDQSRLLQEACRILTETRDYKYVWIADCASDGTAKIAAESSSKAMILASRPHFDHGGLPECCKRALASQVPILMLQPEATCVDCPMTPGIPGTTGMAVALRHAGNVYGVLVATLPAKMADDADEQALFAEVAGDLAFALYDIELEQRRKQTEAEREKLEEQLHSAQKMEAIGRLAGGVAHDFNNLLSVILSYADFALEELRESDPIRVDIVEIQKAGTRAAALTRQLLAFSRKLVLEPTVLDLNRIIADIESMIRRLLGEDINIVVHLANDLGRVEADPSQLEQVIMNLAVNARDAMQRGGKLTIETANMDLRQQLRSQACHREPGPIRHAVGHRHRFGHGPGYVRACL